MKKENKKSKNTNNGPNRLIKAPSSYVTFWKEHIRKFTDLEMLGLFVFIDSYGDEGGVDTGTITNKFGIDEERFNKLFNIIKDLLSSK